MSGKKTHHGSGQGGGLSAAEMKERFRASMDQQPCVTRCMCGWTYEGTAAEGRELAKGHRRAKHPELKPAKRQRSSLQRFTGQKQSDWRKDGLANAAEVAAMIAKREAAA